MREHQPSISVIVCTYTEDRWDDLLRSVRSLEHQSAGPPELVVVVDHNPALLERIQRELPGVSVVMNHEERGLSGARNSGIAASRAEIIAFLDDDAFAEDHWLERLLKAYDGDHVIAVGGRVEPAWDTRRPSYFPDEFDWVVGCTYRGMPAERAAVRNLIGANMSFRREAFDAVGGFVSGIGRVGSVPLGCEETEICIRIRRELPGRDVVFEPAAVVHHRVFPGRGTLRYFASRCLAEGHSKALVSRIAGSHDALMTERAYLRRVLPAGVARGLRAAAHGEPAGLARAALIVVGAALTAFGYVRGRLFAPPLDC